MAIKGRGGLVGVGLSLLVVLSAARPARAECGDFGGLGVAFGTGLGMGVASVSALTFPAIARASEPKLRYWPGVAWTLLGGMAGAVGTGALMFDGCPESSIWVPSVISLMTSGLTTMIWASSSRPKPPPVALLATTPPKGHGMLVGVGSTF